MIVLGIIVLLLGVYLVTGNTYSIPPFSILLSDEKSLATSSCLFIQSFPKSSRRKIRCYKLP